MGRLEKRIATALQQHGDEQRNLALEEAAVLADGYCTDRTDDVAQAIRSIKRTV